MFIQPEIIFPTSAGTIRRGAKTVAILNTGNDKIMFNGVQIPADSPSINLPPIDASEYKQMEYDPQSSSMMLVIIRTE
jgi:hypothetical protein